MNRNQAKVVYKSQKGKRCLSCNSNDIENTVDPKKDFCSKCYFELDEAPNKARLILTLDIEIEKSSVSEIIQHFENLANYTVDISSYDLKIKLLPKEVKSADSSHS